jgi:hypothetical protein
MPKQFSIIAAASMRNGQAVPASVAELCFHHASAAGGRTNASQAEAAPHLSRSPYSSHAVPCIEQVYRNQSKTSAV